MNLRWISAQALLRAQGFPRRRVLSVIHHDSCDNPRVPLFIIVSTAFLVATFVAVCIGAWRIHRSQVKLRPLAERAMLAVIFATVGLQALTYLRADHPQATDARVLAVWIQLVTGFGIAGVAIMSSWFVKRPTPGSSRM